MGVSDRVLVGALKMAIASLASLAAEAKGELMTFPSGGCGGNWEERAGKE